MNRSGSLAGTLECFDVAERILFGLTLQSGGEIRLDRESFAETTGCILGEVCVEVL